LSAPLSPSDAHFSYHSSSTPAAKFLPPEVAISLFLRKKENRLTFVTDSDVLSPF